MAIAERDVYNLLLLAGLKIDLPFNSKMVSPELRFIALIPIFILAKNFNLNIKALETRAVSYTHLTLPTILLV